MTRTCAECGAAITSADSRFVYCSGTCRQRAYRKRVAAERAATRDAVVPDSMAAKLDAITTLVAELEDEVAPLRKCLVSGPGDLALALITFGPADLGVAKEAVVRLHRVAQTMDTATEELLAKATKRST